jgi:K+-sensing histidine kinase KdpD
MQFSDVLASTIHDIKNSLGMVMATLDELTSDPANRFAHPEKVVQLQQEAKRANNDLIQLLMIYKHENGRLGLNINEHMVEDFLDDILIENRALLKARGIDLSMACDPDLVGYFDDDLIRGVLNNTIGNASRYTKSTIHLSADEEEGYLVLRVEDDGPGYPSEMLNKQAANQEHGGFSSGHTKLGLYFSSLVASIHENKGRKGFILMENNHKLPGGCFSILLP